jgi:hypothetical protein
VVPDHVRRRTNLAQRDAELAFFGEKVFATTIPAMFGWPKRRAMKRR